MLGAAGNVDQRLQTAECCDSGFTGFVTGLPAMDDGTLKPAGRLHAEASS